MTRQFVIGDIHGCLNELIELINMLPLKSDDEFIFLGDYIDRGPDSKGVIDFLIGLKDIWKTTFLMGNHERMFIHRDKPHARDMWLGNGGFQTVASYKDVNNIPEDHKQFFDELVLVKSIDNYIFVHGGFDFYDPSNEDFILWARHEFISNKEEWPKKVIFGHTPYKQPLIMDNKIGIDTGCFSTGKLTCVELPSEKFYTTKGKVNG